MSFGKVKKKKVKGYTTLNCNECGRAVGEAIPVNTADKGVAYNFSRHICYRCFARKMTEHLDIKSDVRMNVVGDKRDDPYRRRHTWL